MVPRCLGGGDKETDESVKASKASTTHIAEEDIKRKIRSKSLVELAKAFEKVQLSGLEMGHIF